MRLGAMHLLLIRHGETEHNVAGLLAGVTDSRLTNHGVLQTQRLGAYLINDRGLRFTNVYSSDLQRAFMTANEICKAQNTAATSAQKIEVVQLELLREQDFGPLELVSWASRRVEDSTSQQTDPEFKPKETAASMKSRADSFLDDFILPLLALDTDEPNCIAIVAHGIFLSHMWRALLLRFEPRSVTISPDIASASQTLEHMSWANTGYLEVDIHGSPHDGPGVLTRICSGQTEARPAHVLIAGRMKIKSINDRRHLLKLKRSRGGIGSAAHDRRQQNVTNYFKKRKATSPNNSPPRKTLKPDETDIVTNALKPA